MRDLILERVVSMMHQRLKHLRLCLNDGAIKKCRDDPSNLIIDCVQGLVRLLSVMLR
jgi:hypothetical protein